MRTALYQHPHVRDVPGRAGLPVVWGSVQHLSAHVAGGAAQGGLPRDGRGVRGHPQQRVGLGRLPLVSEPFPAGRDHTHLRAGHRELHLQQHPAAGCGDPHLRDLAGSLRLPVLHQPLPRVPAHLHRHHRIHRLRRVRPGVCGHPYLRDSHRLRSLRLQREPHRSGDTDFRASHRNLCLPGLPAAEVCQVRPHRSSLQRVHGVRLPFGPLH
mmetsp:Transcript_24297/g.33331  ORF Transcript_24297/g.33331 Transcript_24297/m.33331 type:complete len:211 (+) Transcript_24297:813-1445(+)